MTDENRQGEILGLYHSINAFATSISPLVVGSIVAYHTPLVVWGGGLLIMLSGAIYFFSSTRGKVERIVSEG
jgi:hypothetical protein